MAENKTKATAASVATYLAEIDDKTRRADCAALADVLAQATQQPPTMWGTSIVGFGRYSYRYASGRTGESCIVGFSSRKGDISVYGLTAAADAEGLLAQLGKHKAGKGCVYIKKLGDVDLQVLAKLAAGAAAARHRADGADGS